MDNNTTTFFESPNGKTWGWEYDGPKPFPLTEFEDPSPFRKISDRSDHFQVSLSVSLAYILVIFSLQEYMKKRQGLDLKWPLFFWNLALGLFSIFGFIRTAPGLGYALSVKNGFYTSVCLRKYADSGSVFWSFLFTFSKFWELGDTLFIVLRKRPLIFLQWYHHAATMIYSYSISMPLMEPVQRWHMVLNFGVHSLMYPYFALRGVGIKIPRPIANVITTLQFFQMIVGIVINLGSIYYQYAGHHCIRYPVSVQATFVLYGSFLLLFGKLFVDSVLKRGKSKRLKSD